VLRRGRLLRARQIPFVLAVNCFDGVAKHDLDSVREALAVRPEVPVFYTDATGLQPSRLTSRCHLGDVAHAVAPTSAMITVP
jgi:hypothetical protein